MTNIKEEKTTEERIKQIAKNITSKDYMRGYGDAEQKMIKEFIEWLKGVKADMNLNENGVNLLYYNMVKFKLEELKKQVEKT